jgi:gliding motility-associated-like protein
MRCFLMFLLSATLFCTSFCCAQPGYIYTCAGDGAKGFSGDGGPATNAQLNHPSDVFKDAHGNIYIADRGNNRIRKVDAQGIISTVVGNGIAGYSGDGGAALMASLNNPKRIVLDGAGKMYIADENNNVIRLVDTSGIISTIAGTGIAGFSGDGGAATLAQLDTPTGVAIDRSGNIYISDSGCNCIRKINAAGIISTYAGGGIVGFTEDGVPATSVSLCTMRYVAVDNHGTVYFTNQNCWHFLRISTDGLLYNVAGYQSPSFSGDGGPADSANVEGPLGICPDNLGNIYLCPEVNARVRRVNALNYITTVAGTGVTGYSGDGGPAIEAKVNGINGIFADSLGNVYFADVGNNVIRTFGASFYSDTVCAGSGILLNAASAGNGTWSSSNPAVATVDATSGVVTGAGPGSANIIYSDTSGPEIFVVTVNALPANVGGNICNGTVLALSAGNGNGVWASSNAAVATVGAQSGVVTGIAYGTAIITHNTNSASSCPEIFLVNDTCDNISIHDVITPNGDGLNEVWMIDGLQNYPGNTVEIFDKWGNLLFSKTGYQNDWAGKDNKGKPLPDGTYFYLVKLNAEDVRGGKNVFTGSILIKR